VSFVLSVVIFSLAISHSLFDNVQHRIFSFSEQSPSAPRGERGISRGRKAGDLRNRGRGDWYRHRRVENRHEGVGRWPSRQGSISSGRKAFFLEEIGLRKEGKLNCEELFRTLWAIEPMADKFNLG